MEELNEIIYLNPNIENSIKDKIIECTSLIVNKYYNSKENLIENLSHITIRFMSAEEKQELALKNRDSVYRPELNLLLLNGDLINNSNYKYSLIHELSDSSINKGLVNSTNCSMHFVEFK